MVTVDRHQDPASRDIYFLPVCSGGLAASVAFGNPSTGFLSLAFVLFPEQARLRSTTVFPFSLDSV